MLLDLVDRGEVVQYSRAVWRGEEPSFWLKGRDGRGLMVTARVAELRAAGWIELEPAPGHHVEKWRLTEAGRQVLEAPRG